MDERKKKEGNEARSGGISCYKCFSNSFPQEDKDRFPFDSWGLVLEVLENKDPDRLCHVQENPE